MFMRKRKAVGSAKGAKKRGFKKRRGFGSGGGIRAITSPWGPSTVQFGAGKGLTDQAILYKTTGIPGRLGVKFRTSYSGTLTSTSGAFTNSGLASINSLFDPANAQGSILAGGHANWFGASASSADGLYRLYIVTAARLKITLFPGTTNTIPVNFGMRFLPTGQQAAASANAFMANRNAKQCTVASLSGGAASPKILSIYATVAECASDSMASVAIDDTYSAISTASPASLIVADCFIQSLDASTTTTLFYRVELVQWAMLFEPKVAV